jgi:hypothetical protein
VIVAMTNLRFRQNSEKRRRLQAPANAVRWRGLQSSAARPL